MLPVYNKFSNNVVRSLVYCHQFVFFVHISENVSYSNLFDLKGFMLKVQVSRMNQIVSPI